MHIGIDYITSSIINGKISKFTGGCNFAKTIIKRLLREHDIDITLFIPNDYEISDEDMDFFDGCYFKKSSSLDNCDLSKLDIFFLPQVNGSALSSIRSLKKKYSNLKFCGVLHDRQHNYTKYDWQDRIYYRGLRKLGIYDFLIYQLKRIAFEIEYPRTIGSIDLIVTVSNYSMQVLNHKNVKRITYCTQATLFEADDSDNTNQGNYALLVGGNRPEKNIIRSIEGFCKYVSKTGSRLVFKITGINDDLNKIISNYLSKYRDIIDSQVHYYPYVSYDELKKLYKECRFVVFCSKGEGYGLPIREALIYGKPVITSRITSMPEVAGIAAYYVDPFDVNSISEGFQFFDNQENLNRYSKYAKERACIIDKISKQDMSILIDELRNLL